MGRKIKPMNWDKRMLEQNINRGEAIKYFCKKQCGTDEPCVNYPILQCGVEFLWEVPQAKNK